MFFFCCCSTNCPLSPYTICKAPTEQKNVQFLAHLVRVLGHHLVVRVGDVRAPHHERLVVEDGGSHYLLFFSVFFFFSRQKKNVCAGLTARSNNS